MMGLEQRDAPLSPARDPVGAIVKLATEVQAFAIARDAERLAERLEAARLCVSIVGSAKLVTRIVRRIVGPLSVPHDTRVELRFARVPHVRATFRDGSTCIASSSSVEVLARAGASTIECFADSPLLRDGVWVAVGYAGKGVRGRSADVLVVCRAALAELEPTRHQARTLVVDLDDDASLDAAVSAIAALALETGAARVHTLAVQHQRHLCARLGHHLVEQHRALIRSRPALLERINAMTIARAVAESVLEARARLPDPARAELAIWLSTERTKFVMATKADALVAFGDRLERAVHPAHRLRAAAAGVGHAIAAELLSDLWRRGSAEAEKAVAAHARSLRSDVDGSLGDLAEHFLPQALAGFDTALIHRPRRDPEWSAPSRVLARIADCIGLTNRRRIVEASRADLVDDLAAGSRRVIERVLSDYDEASSAIDHRVGELFDAAIQSVQVAAELAEEAQRGGQDRVARARHRIAQSSIDLEAIVTAID